MRTDSTNLAKTAIEAARELVMSQYGKEFLPGEARLYQTKVKNAQEAHEAIRPAGHPFVFPEELRATLNADEFRLYDLIWKRTVASQMSDAQGRRMTISVEGGGALFTVGGKTIDFAGYLRAYVEGSDDPAADLAEQDTVLPSVEVGEPLACRELEPKSHTTQPPARFSEAALTRALEEMGIGRPSTYASIIDTILAREYVFKKGNALVPTWVAFAVAQLLSAHLPNLVDYKFTAQMEDDLDAISRGESAQLDYLHGFYFGNGTPGLKRLLQDKVEEIDARDIGRILIGQPAGGEPIFVRVGRYGPFLEQGERRASLQEDTPPDELSIERSLEMLDQAQQSELPLGYCPDTKKPVYLKVGRFGPYVQRGAPDDEEKPKNASLLKGMKPEDITLEVALKLLMLPRELGANPLTGTGVVAHNGRFGPYVKSGDETRSLPAGLSPLDVTLEQAVELLAQPKVMRRGFGAPKEPLKVFDDSPITGQKIQLLEGRYGMYLNDGVTNASLPKGLAPDSLSKEQALELLATRAAMGPPKKGPRRRAVAKSSAASASGTKTPAAKPKVGKSKKAVPAVNGEGEPAVKKTAKPKRPARKKVATKQA
jgi:DNA topoisomerase-1